MRAQRITRDEIMQALRADGVPDASEVAAVILETDGSISIIKDAHRDAAISTLPPETRA
jgi:uncharacterized membrane protein YcaP (DUF421 family)